MSATLRALQARKADAIKSMRAMSDKAAAEEGRDFTAEEQAEFDKHKAAVESLNASIDREQALIAAEAGMQAPAPAAGAGGVTVPANARITVEHNADADPKRGFANVGDFFKAVHGAAFAQQRGIAPDERLVALAGGGIQAAAPSTYANEGAGADGGFLIPAEFSASIFKLSLTEDALLPMTDEVNVQGNSMTFPKDETTPWGTNGIRAYWQGEAAAATATKPVLGAAALRLKKLMALVPVTEELLEDTAAMASYIPGKVADSIRWKVNEAILFGAGGGLPYGCMNSGAVITVAKESGQAADTLLPANLANMVARLPPGSYGRAVWIINNDVLPQLFTLNNTYQLLYLPYGQGQGAFQQTPYGNLLGRPVLVSQHAKTLGDEGDVLLCDCSYYQSITKAGGVQTATSMHLYFDAAAAAFRTIFRMDGQSKLAAAISPANGSNTLSPFIKLGARA